MQAPVAGDTHPSVTDASLAPSPEKEKADEGTLQIIATDNNPASDATQVRSINGVARPTSVGRLPSQPGAEDDRMLQIPGSSPASTPSTISGLKQDTPGINGIPPAYNDHVSHLGRYDRTHSSTVPPAWLGTQSAPVSLTTEHKRLAQMGETEPLKRDYDTFALLGLTVSNLGFLQGTIFGAVDASSYGGSSMASIGWPITGLFMCCVAGVMAELASAFPVAGAMMTWTFRLARAIPSLRSSARFLSWVTGGFLLCAHVLTLVLLSNQLGIVIQGTVRLYHPTYNPGDWPIAGVSVAIILLATVVAMSTVSRSPWLWKAVLLEYLIAFLFIVIALGVGDKEPLASAEQVFTDYSNATGYNSAPIVYLIGWVQTCLATGQDAAVHMAEETKNPARAAPWAIFWSTVISYVFGWVSICVILAAANNVDLPSDTVLRNAPFAPGLLLTSNLSQGIATAAIILLVVAMFFQSLAQMLAASRYAWALARDNALPLSSVIKRVSSDRIPRYAVLFMFSCSLPGIILVSTVTDVVTTVVLDGVAFTILLAYAIPITLYIVAGPAALDFDGRRQFSLRSASIPLAWVSMLFLALALIVVCFPTASPVNIYDFSWSPVILAGVFLLSCLSWVLYGNYHYAGPIKAVLGPDVELPRFSQIRSQATQRLQDGTPAIVSPLGRGTERKPSEPGTTRLYVASGNVDRTIMQTVEESVWTENGDILSTNWDDEDVDADEHRITTSSERSSERSRTLLQR